MVSAIISGVAALGSAIYGAIKSAKNNREARNLIQQQRDENNRWYNVAMNRDYTARADAQAVFNKQRELLDERIRRARGIQAVTGGSDEALAMEKAAANDAMAQTMTNVAASGAAYKDEVERTARANDAALNQQQAQIEQGRAAEVAKAAGQAVNAGLNLVGQDLKLDGIIRSKENTTATA